MIGLLAALAVSAPAASTAEAACPLPPPEAQAVRALVDGGKHGDALRRLSERQKARRAAGAPVAELACLDGRMGDVLMAWGQPQTAASAYQQGIEALGGRVPPEQRTPPADPEDDKDPSAVTVDLALKRAGGPQRLSDPVLDTLAQRLVEAWIAQGQALEVDGLAQSLLAARRAEAGPDSPPALASLAAVVEVERMLNRWDAAAKSSEDHHARLIRLKGAGAPETLAAGATRAAILVGAGREVDAGRLARQVQADAARTLGPDHATTLTARYVAAQAAIAQAEAPPLSDLEDLAARTRRALGPDHALTLDSETLAIGGLLRAARWAEADRRAQVHFVRLAQARGQLSIDWRIVVGMRAEALLRQGRFNEAVPAYSEAATGLGERLTPAHPLALAATLGWGRAVLGSPEARPFDLQTAESIFERSRAGYEALGLNDQRDEARGWRGRARLRQDRPDAAYGDLSAASAAVWRRRSDPARIASSEAAGDLLRENQTLFAQTIQAGWKWAHQP